MRRYWVESQCFSNDLFTLEGSVLHHIRDVCRQRIGDRFELLCGDGKAYFVEVIEEHKKMSICKVLEVRDVPALPKPHIHLYVSIPRVQKLDFVIEKSVELGVSEVTPFVSEFSFLRKKNALSEGKVSRMNRIVQAATQQCGRGELMVLNEVIHLDDVIKKINQTPEVLGLIPYEGECERNLKQVAQTLDKEKTQAVALIIGSEGGFSEQEVEKCKKASIEPVTVGDQILRVETACVSLVSMLNYELHL